MDTTRNTKLVSLILIIVFAVINQFYFYSNVHKAETRQPETVYTLHERRQTHVESTQTHHQLISDVEYDGEHSSQPTKTDHENEQNPTTLTTGLAKELNVATQSNAIWHLKPQVLYVPCYIDGVFSNFRYFIEMFAKAYHFGVTLVIPDFFAEFQDSGEITSIEGPYTLLGDLFDVTPLHGHISIVPRDSFFSNSQNKHNVEVMFGYSPEVCFNNTKWLDMYNITSAVSAARARYTKGSSLAKLLSQPRNTVPERLILIGDEPSDEASGNIPRRWKYIYRYTHRSELPFGLTWVLDKLQFSDQIRKWAARLASLLGLEDGQYIAVHVRRGNTYSAVQATFKEVSDAVARALSCPKLKTTQPKILLSTLGPFVADEIQNLKQHLQPRNLSIVSVSMFGKVNWSHVSPVLGNPNNAGVLRTLVEVQTWTQATSFVATRSTMSGYAWVKRTAAAAAFATEPTCNYFAQQKWLRKKIRIHVP